ncbi:hypothetical protein JT359_10300 [Candidatus Poribacteria bacterium]|nr:hypothetical protein [Candidatus Poribacteria bacterium]
MRFNRVLMILMVSVTTVYLGCGDQQMVKPIMEIIDPTEPISMEPDIIPIDSLEMAQQDIDRVNQRRTEALNIAMETGDYITMFRASETILNEELGFRRGFWVELVEIYRDENSDDTGISVIFDSIQNSLATALNEETFEMDYFDNIRIFDPLIVEYLRLSYENPTEVEEGLLSLFRESVQAGNVSIELNNNS